jgi:hypothetical protein
VVGPIALGAGFQPSINEIGQITALFEISVTEGVYDTLVSRWTPYGNVTRVLPVQAGTAVAMHPKYGALVTGGVYWSPYSGAHTLTVPRGVAGLDARAINASGVVVGGALMPPPASRSFENLHNQPAFAWQSPNRLTLLTQPTPRVSQQDSVTATGINSHGVIVGAWTIFGVDFVTRTGIMWRSMFAAPEQLRGGATGINDCAEVSLILDDGAGHRNAFVRGPAGTERDLATEVSIDDFFARSDDSRANGISQMGWVAGDVILESGRRTAILWRPDGGTPLVLRPLAGDASSEAWGVNSRGQVAGVSYGPGNSRVVRWTVPSATFAGTVALIRARIASLNGLSSTSRTQLEADLDAAARAAALGYVAPARAAFAAYSSHLEASAGALSTHDRAILSDAGICLSESLRS